MLEPLGYTSIWEAHAKSAKFAYVHGKFDRISFAYKGIMVAFVAGPFDSSGGSVEVVIEGVFIDLMAQMAAQTEIGFSGLST